MKEQKNMSIQKKSKSNLGEIIKIFAQMVFAIDIIAIILILANLGIEKSTTVISIIYLFVGGIFSFIFLYGFGEIISRLISIDEKI